MGDASSAGSASRAGSGDSTGSVHPAGAPKWMRLPHRHHPHGTFEGRSSRQYDRVARSVMSGLYRRIADDLAIAVPDNAALLDVGTGPGMLLVELARRRGDLRLTGVDLSADMVALAKRNTAELAGRVSAQVADVADLPFDTGSFDVVVTTLSLHHWEDVTKAVPELARVLRPGGRVFVYDLRRGPFDALDAAAASTGRFAGPAQHAAIWVGPLHLWRIARHVLSTRADQPAPQG